MSDKKRPAFNDIVALILLKAAKLGRKKLDTDDNYDEFYEKFFEEKDNESYLLDARMKVRRDTILNYLKKFPEGSRILDVGCGLGDVLEQIPSHFELTGVDYAESNVKYASKRLGSKAVIRQSRIYDLPFEKESFDICLCLEVLEHIEDDKKAVREISRVLKQGGVLMAAVPYTYYWKSYKKLLGHYRHYTKDSFTALLLGNGFSSIEEYLPNYYNWHQKYTKRYAFLVAEYKLLNRIFGYKSLFEFKLPWQKKPAIKIMEDRLEKYKEADKNLDYSGSSCSTFLAVVK